MCLILINFQIFFVNRFLSDRFWTSRTLHLRNPATMGLDPAKYVRYEKLKNKLDAGSIEDGERSELNELLLESEQNRKIHNQKAAEKAKKKELDELKKRLLEVEVEQFDPDDTSSEKNEESDNEIESVDTDELLEKIDALHNKLRDKAVKPRLKDIAELDTNDPKVFKDWSQKFESDMDDFELHHFVLGSFTSADVNKPLFKKYDAVAKKLLCRNISLRFREMIAGDPTAYVAYQRIESRLWN